MSRQHHYRRLKRSDADSELDMTTFMNLMVVLVPFLLVTAVFSRITIVELSLPSASGGSAAVEPSFRMEVIVRGDGLQLSDGSRVIASLPKLEDAYDLAGLTEHALALKRQHPDVAGASVLLEPQIEYDHLIQVMDAVRSTTQAAESGGEPQRIALFTDISIGDAP